MIIAELILSCALLIATSTAIAHRCGSIVNAGSLAALGLLVYLPLRGLLLHAFVKETSNAINIVAALKLGTHADDLAASYTLLWSALFCGVVILPVWRPQTNEQQHGASRAIARVGSAMLIVGLPALLLQVEVGLSSLQLGEADTGVLGQVRQSLVFCFAAGIMLRLASGATKRLTYAALTLGLVITLMAASKDLATLFAVAALLGAHARTQRLGRDGRATRATRFGGSRIAILFAPLLLVMLVFPMVSAYRLALVGGAPPVEAFIGSPQRALGEAINGEGLLQPVLFVTARLNGYDAVLVSAEVTGDPSMLTWGQLLTSPAGGFLPSSVTDLHPERTGRAFAYRYWQHSEDTITSIAPGTFNHARLGIGLLGSLVVVMILASLAGYGSRLSSRTDSLSLVVALVLMTSLFAVERDIVFIVGSGLRHFLACLTVIFIMSLSRSVSYHAVDLRAKI